MIVPAPEENCEFEVFPGPTDVGGRYSALTHFGLVPAALLGIDLDRLLGSARQMAAQCGPTVPTSQNPGALLALHQQHAKADAAALAKKPKKAGELAEEKKAAAKEAARK